MEEARRSDGPLLDTKGEKRKKEKMLK